MTGRRSAAIAALAVGGATVVFALAAAIDNFPNAVVVLGCLAVAVLAGWFGLRRRGPARVVGLGAAAVLAAGAIAALVLQRNLIENALVLAGVAVALGAAARAFATQ